MIKKANIPAVLMLIFGMSSMASALMLVVGDGTTFTDPGDEVSIDIGDTIWIGIYDYIGEMYDAHILSWAGLEGWTGNTAIYSPPAISTAPGWTHEIDGLSEWWFVDLSDPGSTETPLPGVGCAIEFHALSGAGAYIYLNLWPGGFEDEFLLNIVPEPTTILLLALGSLALIRRRR
ncbi:MAG: PEP-CTERM sorting domain-containing protein [Planctomycetota bacterium]|jgi:hypothetical protein